MRGIQCAWTRVLAAACVVAAACGGDATGPAVNRNDPGTGTGTLRVIADIDGNDDAAGFTTEFSVSLRDAVGAAVSGATVTVRNATLGTVTLAETGTGTGDYFAQRSSFAAGDYRLDVIRGADSVQNVAVGGIATHGILEPAAHDTVPAGEPLLVRWSVPTEAVRADLESRDYVVEGIPDSGSHTIPETFVVVRSDERIRVRRFNEVEIAGGLPGSRLQLSVRNSVEPIVVQ